MPDIIVIGAGVLGTSVAYRLASAGVKVTVLEATRVGGGTSGVSFAWTNSCNKAPRAYHDLNVAGMRAHAALMDEFGSTPWWHGGGRIEWKAPAEQAEQKAKVARLQDWDYPSNGSIASRRLSWSRTSRRRRSATRRSPGTRGTAGSIRSSTRTR